jgi:hypothetical protein
MMYLEELHAYLCAQLELQRVLEEIHGEGAISLIEDEL